MERSTSARWVATETLHRVAVGGAWAAPTLDAALRTAKLSDRDARLAVAIVYGALRVLPTLDAALDAHLRTPENIDAFTRAALRVGCFQLLYLPRVPVSAAVNESVAIVKRKRGKLAGLTNAVLRKIRRSEEAAPPTTLDVPPWVRERLEASLDARRVQEFLGERPLPPPLHVQVYGDVDAWIAVATEAMPRAEFVALPLPGAVAITRAGDPRQLPGYDDGAFSVQDLGSQIIGAAVGAEDGERILDACAGRGGKTTTLRRAVGSAGQVVAADLHEPRLDQIATELTRLRLPSVETAAIDWSVGDGGLEGHFDRALIDAPCTGLGTIHRRPEILLRLEPDAAATLAALQQKIVSRVAGLVRPGGTLVYAVCSPDRAEGEVALDAEWSEDPLPGSDADGVRRIGPWSGGAGQSLDGQDNDGPSESDAYQVRRWRRVV